jgi:hypothetical protein
MVLAALGYAPELATYLMLQFDSTIVAYSGKHPEE